MADITAAILNFLKAIGKYRWQAVFITWAVAIAGWVVVMKLPNQYEASARVYVDTQSILKPLLSGMTTLPNLDQQVVFMRRTLLSRPNVERVMRMVDLDVKAKNAKEHDEMVDELMEKIKIGGTERDDIYTISYTAPDAKLGKDVVQSLLTIFVEGSFGGKKQDSAKAVQFIDDQIRNYEEKLAAAENSLKEFKIRHMGMLPATGGGDFGTRMVSASEALNTARLELAEAEQARNAIRRRISGEAAPGETTPIRITDPELEARVAAVTKTLDSLRTQYTEAHPDIIANARLLEQLNARKQELAKNGKPSADPGAGYSPMLQQLNVSLSEAEARVASLRARVNEYWSGGASAHPEQPGAGSRGTAGPAQPRLRSQPRELPEAGGAPRIGQAVGRPDLGHRHAELPHHRSADRAAAAVRTEPPAPVLGGVRRRTGRRPGWRIPAEPAASDFPEPGRPARGHRPADPGLDQHELDRTADRPPQAPRGRARRRRAAAVRHLWRGRDCHPGPPGPVTITRSRREHYRKSSAPH